MIYQPTDCFLFSTHSGPESRKPETVLYRAKNTTLLKVESCLRVASDAFCESVRAQLSFFVLHSPRLNCYVFICRVCTFFFYNFFTADGFFAGASVSGFFFRSYCWSLFFLLRSPVKKYETLTLKQSATIASAGIISRSSCQKL